MPETVAYAIMYAADYAGVEVAASTVITASEIIVATAAVASMRYEQLKAQGAAKDAYNASLKDRYVMGRTATGPRQVVLGRQRVSGPLAYIGSYGTNLEHLVFTVLLAAHEIDAIEAIYFDNEQVTLDGSGNVLAVNRREEFTLTGASSTYTLTTTPVPGTVTASVAYGTTVVTLGVSVSGESVTVTGGTVGQTGTVTVIYQPSPSPFTAVNASTYDATASIVLDATGHGTVTLPAAPVSGSVSVVYASTSGWDGMQYDLTSFSSVSGNTVTVTGASQNSVTATVSYRATGGSTGASKARVRKYLGAAGQAADAGMIAALPGIWDSSHTMSGLAYLVVELDYDPNAFPGGIPNVSAVVRGAKLYDPRASTTVWSENPALMMRYVALSPLLGNQSAAQINDTSIAAAANICDGSVTYVVNGQNYTRALYTAGITVPSGTRAKDTLDELAKSMAGRWIFIDGLLRLKAGAYATPLQTLDETWLSSSGSVQVQAKANRSDVFNVVTGKFADQTRDYQVLDYPRVSSSTYITTDGQELPLDMTLNAVTFSGQCQQVVATAMRDARAGMRLTVTCNMRAYQVEVFDVIYVTLSRFGWVNKTFEVLDVTWNIDGGIQLSMKETDATVYALGTSFTAYNPALSTSLPSPFAVPDVGTLTLSSGTSQLLKLADGTILSRISVSWISITDGSVVNNGGVEIRYGLAIQPENEWQSIKAINGQNQIYLNGVRDGLIYLVKARAFNALINGAWGLPFLHQVVGKTAPPSNVSGLTSSLQGYSSVTLTWTPITDLDAFAYEVRSGASWASGVVIGQTSAATYTLSSAPGSLRLMVKAIDTTKNYSTTEAVTTITVPVSAAPTSLTFSPERFGVRLNCAASASSGVSRYEWRVGSAWATSTLIGADAGTSYLWGVQTVGTYTAWVAAVDALGNYSTPASMTVTVGGPTASFTNIAISNLDLVMDYAGTSGSFAITGYELRYGSTWAGATSVGVMQLTRHVRRIDWTGTRRWWVCPIDAAGNYGTPTSSDVVITPPGEITSARAEVVDNNVLLYFSAPATGSLPIDRYEVRKGVSWSAGALVGSNGNSTFATVFEQQSGVFTYWVAAWDSAGNLGTPFGITATVNQPPDYILRTNINSTFSGTLTNMYIEAGVMIGPANTSESFGSHFTAHSWATPQDQINAGYPLYIEPALTSGTYDESFDYGAVLAASTITATLGSSVITGSVTVSCQIYYKTASGDPWTAAAAGATSVLATNFRYVRVVWTFSCIGGANLIGVTSFNLKLANKLRTDSGSGTAAVGGTAVTFNLSFVSADTPLVQPNGATPLIPVVIYGGGANPTGFTVKLYNTAGTDVGGAFSWTARGY